MGLEKDFQMVIFVTVTLYTVSSFMFLGSKKDVIVDFHVIWLRSFNSSNDKF
jgi:hypothetical protein